MDRPAVGSIAVNDAEVHEVDGASLVIRPNRSLPVTGVLVLFAALSTLALTIGVGFALAGAWFVLAFAFLEVIVVGLLCRWLYRHLDDCEWVLVEPDRVSIIKRRGTEVSQHDFVRYWVRVTVERRTDRASDSRLLIGSHGRFLSLADDVNEADRAAVARELDCKFLETCMCVVRSLSRRGAWYRWTSAALLAVVPGLAAAEYRVNFPPPVTSIAESILELHNLIFVICAVIFVIVFAFMFYSIVVHRKSRGYKPATFHDSVKLEVLWTVIPFLILVGMAIPSTATLIAMSDVSKSEMTVKITGFQWKWRYDYPDQDIGYFSMLTTSTDQIEGRAPKDKNYLLEVDNPLVLPVGKKIRLIVTANDVIHSWWVPEFGIKKDAIPGFINEVWVNVDKPGVYRGQCAELCGNGHGFMPIVVDAVSQEDFDKWVVAQKQKSSTEAASADKIWTKDELMTKGKQVYGQCAACHQPDGKGMAGVFPALAGSKVANGPLAEHIETVLQGRHTGKFPAAMPAFGPQLSDVDIAAVITYERNSFGNKTGDVVQPAQVKAAR